MFDNAIIYVILSYVSKQNRYQKGNDMKLVIEKDKEFSKNIKWNVYTLEQLKSKHLQSVFQDVIDMWVQATQIPSDNKCMWVSGDAFYCFVKLPRMHRLVRLYLIDTKGKSIPYVEAERIHRYLVHNEVDAIYDREFQTDVFKYL